jgi:hypothetical protein
MTNIKDALEPFARIPLAHTDDIDDSANVFEYEGGAIHLGDLRRVHQALSQLTASPDREKVAAGIAALLISEVPSLGSFGAKQITDRILSTIALDEAAIRADASCLDFFEKNQDMELSCTWDDTDKPWQVHSVTGGRNDREWKLVGDGATPREAIAAAIRSQEAGR